MLPSMNRQSSCDERAATVQTSQRSSSKRRRRRFLERDTDEERLIVRDKAFSKVHEISHYRQLSETDRTVISARQTKNDDHGRHIRVRRRQENRVRKTKSMRAFSFWEKNNTLSHHSLIIIDHHHVFYNILDHSEMSFSRARIEYEIKTSKVR
jgi:predicted aminopeptidase